MISIHEQHRGLKPKITKIEKLQKRRTTTIPNIFFPIIKWSCVIYSLQSYTISYIGTALTHYVLIFLSFFTWTMIYPYWWSNWSSIIGYASSFSPLLMPQASCRCIPPPKQTKNSSFFFFFLLVLPFLLCDAAEWTIGTYLFQASFEFIEWDSTIITGNTDLRLQPCAL